MTIYFGFALADSMFEGDCIIRRRAIGIDDVKTLIAQGITSCLNPSHKSTIEAMRQRFGIDVAIPDIPTRVILHSSDKLIVMGVRGLPRMVGRHEYTIEEIAVAQFSFVIYVVE